MSLWLELNDLILKRIPVSDFPAASAGYKDEEQTFKHVRHLADLGEGGAVGPGVHHVHQVGLELVKVRLLVHLQLGIGGDLGDTLCALLPHGEKATAFTFQPNVTNTALTHRFVCFRLTCICLSGAASCSVSFGISLA